MTEAEPQPPNVDDLLSRLRDGDVEAQNQLFPVVYDELRRIARGRVPHPAGTLQATALVNEAYLRLCRQTERSWNDRAHFFRAAGVAMRSVLVDYARRRKAQKRPDPSKQVELNPDVVASFEARVGDLAKLDEALARLRERDAALAELVDLHFFGGRTFEECARIFEVSDRTIRRWWTTARAVLRRDLGDDS